MLLLFGFKSNLSLNVTFDSFFGRLFIYDVSYQPLKEMSLINVFNKTATTAIEKIFY